VAELDVRLCLSGHGKPFTDIPGHIEGNRKLVAERLEGVLRGLDGRPRTAVELAPYVHGTELNAVNAAWYLTETLCYLRHLELQGRVRHEREGEIERWRVT
jgi:hypothetical protein